jgi:hypothetical protein
MVNDLSIPGIDMRQILQVVVGLLLVSALLIGGCEKRTRSGVVTGTVTYKGKPVNDAALFLYPPGSDGTEAPITIPVAEDGNFTIRDLPPGKYKIVVEGATGGEGEAAMLKLLPPEKQAEMKGKMGAQKSPVTISFPDKYKKLTTTDLTCEITDSPQTLNLELKD